MEKRKIGARYLADNLHVIVNGVTAELHGIYEDEVQCKADCEIMNTLGVYATMTLQEHLDNLLTWFNHFNEDHGR